MELNEHRKTEVADFCEKAERIIKEDNKSLITLIIQLRGSEIYLGRSYSVKPYGFRPDFYDPTKEDRSADLSSLIDNDGSKIVELWNDIKATRPNKRLKTLNIFFRVKDRTIEICENRIGGTSKSRCRLFDMYKL